MEGKFNMHRRNVEWGWEMDGTTSESYPRAGFGISCFEIL